MAFEMVSSMVVSMVAGEVAHLAAPWMKQWAVRKAACWAVYLAIK